MKHFLVGKRKYNLVYGGLVRCREDYGAMWRAVMLSGGHHE